jgi:uncharacterized protein YjiK
MNKAKTNIKMIISYLLLLVFMNIFGCSNSTDKSRHSADTKGVNVIGYNLSEPDRTIVLPLILKEVSGITLIDTTSVACVQDENGTVFIVDMSKNEITNQLIFHSNGDYEGIARSDSAIYVLRSDGVLFQILNQGSSGALKKIFSVGIPPLDNEGLCYDKKNNRLLIVAKNSPGKDSENKGKHPVYGFDLRSEILLGVPVFDFDLSEIKKFASDNDIQSSEGDGKIGFKPSAIGIHPLTNKLFVLSGIEQMLFVFNMNGTIEYIEKLDPGLFNMPEGIAFFENGDMLISNEGRINPPVILKFNYKIK